MFHFLKKFLQDKHGTLTESTDIRVGMPLSISRCSILFALGLLKFFLQFLIFHAIVSIRRHYVYDLNGSTERREVDVVFSLLLLCCVPDWELFFVLGLLTGTVH